MRRAFTVAILLGGMLLTAGCGVTTQDSPKSISPEDVPFGLLRESPPASTAPKAGSSSALLLYFVGPGGLVPVPREVAGDGSARTAVSALLQGPTSAEAQGGIRSALPPDAEAQVTVRDRRATVDLDSNYLELSQVEQGLAVAQLVYTLTGVDEVDTVRFRVAGNRLTISVRDGTPTSDPVSRDQVVIPRLP